MYIVIYYACVVIFLTQNIVCEFHSINNVLQKIGSRIEEKDHL